MTRSRDEAALESLSGNLQLFPGKPVTPMDSLTSMGNNKFKVGLIDRESKQLSQQGKVTLKLNFK